MNTFVNNTVTTLQAREQRSGPDALEWSMATGPWKLVKCRGWIIYESAKSVKIILILNTKAN